MSKKNIPIGFDRLYFGVMTDEETEVYGTPKPLPGSIELSIKPNVSTASLPADDIIYASENNLSDYDVEMTIAELDTASKAELLGHSIDSNGGLVEKTTDRAPYVALMYRRRLFNGKFKYVILYKVKFAPAEETAKTKGENIEFQTPKITGKAIPRAKDAMARNSYTEGDAGVTASFLDTFFNSVPIPGADTTPPTVTIVPANNATAVAVGVNIVWTFNEAIAASTVSPANFLVQKADGSGVVAGSLTLDATGKIVTFDPTSNLTAATAYMAIVGVGVKDLAGNALAAPLVTKFTTA